MSTLSKTFSILIVTGSVLFGHVAASLAIGDKLGVPIEEAAPLVPVGNEFQVNTFTTWDQENPAMAMDSDGDFVVVWQSGNEESPGLGQDGSAFSIYAQRYDHTGSPLGGEFKVNSSPPNSLTASWEPDVAIDGDGDFVVVWQQSDGPDFRGIFGQRFDKFGNPIGIEEFPVNTYTDDWTQHPSIAMNNNGKFVVAWQSMYQDGSPSSIFAQRYDHTGTPEGSEFQVNTYTTDWQENPSVAMDDDGNFVVVWISSGQDGDNGGIFGQRYDHTGAPEGPEFQINTYTTGGQTSPDVAMDSDGNFVVIWISYSSPGPGNDHTVLGQRYDFTGTPVGSEFQIAAGPDVFYAPSVAIDDNRNAWMAWRSTDQDSSGVFAQGFDPTGALIGSEFQVNTYTMNVQSSPDITITNSGHAVVAWHSKLQDGDQGGIFAQRYTTNHTPTCDEATPVPSMLFTNDHAFNVIDIANVTDPDGDTVYITVNEIYQDEAVNAAGSGFTSPDGKGIGTNAAEVRDEHVIGGNGRTYRIHFTAEDEWGSSCSKAVYVHASPKVKYDWDWIIYDSTDTPDIAGELLNPTPPSDPGTRNPSSKVAP